MEFYVLFQKYFSVYYSYFLSLFSEVNSLRFHALYPALFSNLFGVDKVSMVNKAKNSHCFVLDPTEFTTQEGKKESFSRD